MLVALSVCAGPQTVAVTITVTEPVHLKLEVGNVEQYDRDIRSLQQQVSDLQQQLAEYKSELQKSGGSLHAMKQQLLLSQTSSTLERQKTRHLAFKLEAVTSGEAMLSTLSRNSSVVTLPDDMARVSKPELSSTGVPTAEQQASAVAGTAAVDEDAVPLADLPSRATAPSSSTLVSPRASRTSIPDLPVHLCTLSSLGIHHTR